MMNKKQTIRTVALTILCMVALPVQAFNLRDLLNSFKRNPQAQIIAGFFAATAAVAYLVYRDHFKTHTKPSRSTSISGLANGSQARRPATNLDLKHTAERRQAEMDTLGNIIAQSSAKKPVTKPSSQNDRDLYNVTRTNPVDQETLKQIKAEAKAAHESSSAVVTIAPVKPRSLDQGGNGSKPSVANSENTLKQQKLEIEAALDDAAEKSSKQSLLGAQQELATENVFGDLIARMAKRLNAIEDALHETNISLEEKDAQLVALAQAREEIFSLNVLGTDLDKHYADNFKRCKDLIHPKEAYQALKIFNVLRAQESAGSFTTKQIDARLDKRIKEMETEKDKKNEIFALRQLKYIFRNDITRSKYDAYIAGILVPSVRIETFKELTSKLQSIQKAAGEEPDDYEWIKSSDHPENQADLATRIANSLSLLPTAQETRAAQIASYAKRAIDSIYTRFSPKTPPFSDQKDVKSQSESTSSIATDLMTQAGDAARRAGSAVISAAASTAAAVSTVITSASSSTVPTSNTVVPDRPAPVVIDRSEPETIATSVDPLPAAQANKLALIDNKAKPVINAGSSLTSTAPTTWTSKVSDWAWGQ